MTTLITPRPECGIVHGMDTTPIVAWLEAELVTLHAFQHFQSVPNQNLDSLDSVRNHLSIALDARGIQKKTSLSFVIRCYLLPKIAFHVNMYSSPVILKRQSPFRLDTLATFCRHLANAAAASAAAAAAAAVTIPQTRPALCPALPCPAPSFPLSSQNIPPIHHHSALQLLVKIAKDNPLFPSLKVPPTASQPV